MHYQLASKNRYFLFSTNQTKEFIYIYIYKLWHQSNQTSNEKKVKLVFKLSERIYL